MNTSISEETAAARASFAGEQPKATKKASRAPRRAHVAPKKGRSGKKASPAKRAPKTAPKPKGSRPGKAAKEKEVREGSKTAQILDLLKRTGGATAKDLQKATGWQPHSVRGSCPARSVRKWG